jgi:hypothetical protein
MKQQIRKVDKLKQPTTSATRQVRQQWFSVCTFPLSPGDAGPAIRPCVNFQRYF